MTIEQYTITHSTKGRGTVDITSEVAQLVAQSKVQTGLCNIFLQHTSASLIICENYDVDVKRDLENFLARIIPDGDPLFRHVIEGTDDMPAHIRTILTQTSMMIPIQAGNLALGTWQGIYLYEHRIESQQRHVLVTVYG